MDFDFGFLIYQGGGLGGDALAAAGEAEAFGRGGLDADAVEREAEVGGNRLAHLFYIRKEFGSLRNDCDVDIPGSEAALGKKFDYAAKEHARVGSLIAGISVGKVIAYIAKGGSAQQRVAKSVEGHVGVAMAQQPERMLNLHSAEP